MIQLKSSNIAFASAGIAVTLICYGTLVQDGGLIWKAAGFGVGSLGLFSTRATPEIVTAFGIFLVALALGIVPAEKVFSGFVSGGFWLLVSGIILGTAITSTGLADEVSKRLILYTGQSYPKALIAVAICGMVLGFLVPSTMPRIVVIIPIALALASRFGLDEGAKGTIGLIATSALATLLPTYTILTANLPTIVHVGAIDQVYGIHTTYSEYFIYQLPVNILRLGVIVMYMLWFTKDVRPSVKYFDLSSSKLTKKQLHLLIILVCAISFWATDFIHHIPPAWISLVAATVVIWPRFGMLSSTAMKEKIDLTPAIFLASIITVVTVATEAGLDHLVSDFILRILPDQNGGLAAIFSVFGVSFVLSHLTTAPAAPAVLVPLAQNLSEATGLSMNTTLMTQIIGISTPAIPYQAPPLIIAMSLSKVPNLVFLKICMLLSLVVMMFGLPITYAWWSIITP
ncbi:hypothetical protein LSUCC0246_02520 [Rhodobacterales bacterium LSUCC0246]|nr:hypothetical protein [Rhodobacterales bacterium LSUCC0374]